MIQKKQIKIYLLLFLNFFFLKDTQLIAAGSLVRRAMLRGSSAFKRKLISQKSFPRQNLISGNSLFHPFSTKSLAILDSTSVIRAQTVPFSKETYESQSKFEITPEKLRELPVAYVPHFLAHAPSELSQEIKDVIRYLFKKKLSFPYLYHDQYFIGMFESMVISREISIGKCLNLIEIVGKPALEFLLEKKLLNEKRFSNAKELEKIS